MDRRVGRQQGGGQEITTDHTTGAADGHQTMLRPSTCVRTCLPCHRSKVKCDKNSPCGRCVRLGWKCIANPRGIGRPRLHRPNAPTSRAASTSPTPAPPSLPPPPAPQQQQPQQPPPAPSTSTIITRATSGTGTLEKLRGEGGEKRTTRQQKSKPSAGDGEGRGKKREGVQLPSHATVSTQTNGSTRHPPKEPPKRGERPSSASSQSSAAGRPIPETAPRVSRQQQQQQLEVKTETSHPRKKPRGDAQATVEPPAKQTRTPSFSVPPPAAHPCLPPPQSHTTTQLDRPSEPSTARAARACRPRRAVITTTQGFIKQEPPGAVDYDTLNGGTVKKRPATEMSYVSAPQYFVPHTQWSSGAPAAAIEGPASAAGSAVFDDMSESMAAAEHDAAYALASMAAGLFFP